MNTTMPARHGPNRRHHPLPWVLAVGLLLTIPTVSMAGGRGEKYGTSGPAYERKMLRARSLHYGSVRHGHAHGGGDSRPPGRVLTELPPGTTYVRRDGEKYYLLDGVYYERRIGGGSVVYVPVDGDAAM